MGSAHLTEANICPKFIENLSKGSGDMERTRKCYGRIAGRTFGQTDERIDGRTDEWTDEGHSYNPLCMCVCARVRACVCMCVYECICPVKCFRHKFCVLINSNIFHCFAIIFYLILHIL